MLELRGRGTSRNQRHWTGAPCMQAALYRRKRMKITTIALATALSLSPVLALAQSGGGSGGGAGGGSTGGASAGGSAGVAGAGSSGTGSAAGMTGSSGSSTNAGTAGSGASTTGVNTSGSTIGAGTSTSGSTMAPGSSSGATTASAHPLAATHSSTSGKTNGPACCGVVVFAPQQRLLESDGLIRLSGA
ncbi:MAG: hypothetical protein JWP85_2730 [Rhodoglobus sp.]|nr:hypothetical protein [Rhodoglobus sp.]